MPVRLGPSSQRIAPILSFAILRLAIADGTAHLTNVRHKKILSHFNNYTF